MIVPDYWKLIETTSGIKIFSSWYDESWRLSSVIVSAKEVIDGEIEIQTTSGTIYKVYHYNYGCICMYNATVLQTLSTKPTVISVLDDYKVLNLL